MLTAADVMTTDVVSIDPEKPVRNIAELLRTRRISGVPVVDADGVVIGIVSEGDLIGHAAIVGERRRSWWLSLFADESVSARDYIKTHGRTAREVMTTNVITVEETATLAGAKRSSGIGSSASRWFGAASSSASSHAATCSGGSRPRNQSRPPASTIRPSVSSSCANSRTSPGPMS